ncbi:unnamed protein product [Linum tenue]|uniref:Uncharacterized protein n=1 Tax=Linum tenue TaxID=586396 RepID=A0AAV0LEN5_9ROSI|nr:unnamed protein product [Linum tenue]
MADSRSEILKRLRCHHCAGPLTKEAATSGWTNRPLLRDSFSMIGTAVGGTAGAFYGFNHVMPIVQKYIKRANVGAFLCWCKFRLLLSFSLILLQFWNTFSCKAPPVIVFASACAGFAGGAIPALAQLVSSGYHAAVSSPSLNPQEDKVHRSGSSSTL